MTNPFETIDERLGKIENLLLDLKNTSEKSEAPVESDELLTVKDAANFLHLTVPTIYGLISRKELPVMKRSKRCYFSKHDLLNYLKAGRKKTNVELSAEADSYMSRKKNIAK